MNISSLREAGLTEGEVKSYLALLEIGSSTTGPIIEKTGIARSIIYTILEKLIQKGLVSVIVKEKTKYFQAANPKKILDYLDEKEKKFEKNKKEIEELLPELLSKKQTKKSETTMYFGLTGIRTAHENLYLKLGKDEEYYFLGIPAFQPEEQHMYWKRDHQRRIKSGIKCRLLFNKDTDPKVLKNRNSYKGSEARYMFTDIKTPAAFLIYKDTVTIILQHAETLSIEIVNQSIADSFKAYFEEFWRRSEK